MARLKSLSIVVTLVLAGALTISLTAQGGPFRGHADLSGFQENPTLSTPARGTIDVDISRDGQSMAIVGPSGCGKTTLLNIVAGLLRYDAGRVIIDGAQVDGPGVYRAVVFQQASLLPWRTVAGNVRYGMSRDTRGSSMPSVVRNT